MKISPRRLPKRMNFASDLFPESNFIMKRKKNTHIYFPKGINSVKISPRRLPKRMNSASHLFPERNSFSEKFTPSTSKENEFCARFISRKHFYREKEKKHTYKKKLTLNLDKTKCMLIGSNRKRESKADLAVSILDHSISNVRSFKYLGIHISSDFTWTDHVEHLTGKFNQRLGLLERIKHFIKQSRARLPFYKSLVIPLF